jgi:accessory gene regulator protein AgrB
MSDDQKQTFHDEKIIEKFAGQMVLFHISHFAMLVLVAVFIAAAVFFYRYYGGGAGALNVKGIILGSSVILLIVLGIFERVIRENFLKCPACGELLKNLPSGSIDGTEGTGKDCPKCGTRLKR